MPNHWPLPQVFRSVQDEYAEEGVGWSFVDFADNQGCLDLLEGRVGVLALLDEECVVPKGSDAGLATKLADLHRRDLYFEPAAQPGRGGRKAGGGGGPGFMVRHYAGTVEYTVSGFLEKNRDRQLATETAEMLSGSANVRERSSIFTAFPLSIHCLSTPKTVTVLNRASSLGCLPASRQAGCRLDPEPVARPRPPGRRLSPASSSSSLRSWSDGSGPPRSTTSAVSNPTPPTHRPSSTAPRSPTSSDP